MRNDQLVRVLRLAQALCARPGGLSVAEMIALGGAGRRTVYRDLEALEQLGFPLYAEGDGDERRWRLTEGFRSRIGVPFALDELVALHVARKAMPGLAGGGFAPSLERAFAKIAGCLQAERAAALERRQSRLTVAPGPVRSRRSDAVLAAVEAAVDSGESLSIVYKSPRRKKATRRLVDPYRLHGVGGAAYLVAFCRLRRAMRVFLVDRIRLVVPSGKRFDRQHQAEASRWYDGSFATFSGPAEVVSLLFEPEAVPYLLERTWHTSQRLEADEDGRVRMRIKVHPGPDLEAWVRSWGRLVLVLEPSTLRRRVANDLLAAAAQYNRKRTALQTTTPVPRPQRLRTGRADKRAESKRQRLRSSKRPRD